MSQPVHADTQLKADEIIGKAVERSQSPVVRTDRPSFTYTKVAVTEEFDAAGKVKEHKEKVYQVSFRGGSSFAKLLEVNGHAPAEADLKKQADNELSLHQILGEGKATKGDNRESFLTPQVAARFDFKLSNVDSLNGRRAYVIDFKPKTPALPTHRLVDRLLDRLSGRLWIDVEEFEIARAEVQLRSEVDLLGGLVGCLRKLAYTVTRTRVADGVWLNSFSSGDFEGRKLLDSMHIKMHSESSNFRPLT
jgi:hypothetical protein